MRARESFFSLALMAGLALHTPALDASLHTLGDDIHAIVESQGDGVLRVLADLGAGVDRMTNGVVWDRSHLVVATPLLALAERILVEMPGGESVAGRFLGLDPITGLGVVRADASLPASIPLAGRLVSSGGSVVTVGGGGEERIVALGQVTGIRDSRDARRPPDLYQLSMPFSSECIGSAALDINGNILGFVNGSQVRTRAGLRLASVIPVGWARRGIERLIAGGHDLGYGFLGVTVEESEPQLPGLRVIEVEPAGPAEEAGLHAGDRILNVNDHSVLSADGLVEAVVYTPAGAVLRMAIGRADSTFVLTACLGSRRARGGDRNPKSELLGRRTISVRSSGGNDTARAGTIVPVEPDEEPASNLSAGGETALPLDSAVAEIANSAMNEVPRISAGRPERDILLMARVRELEQQVSGLRLSLEECGLSLGPD